MISLAHRTQYAALRGTVRALQRLSWGRAGDVGALLGTVGYRPLGVRRRVVERQLAAAFPELSPAEVQRTARAAYEHLGRVTIEAALVPSLGPAACSRFSTSPRGGSTSRPRARQGAACCS
jgi:KDO2-lipid IV(A) lauroyltransferase